MYRKSKLTKRRLGLGIAVLLIPILLPPILPEYVVILLTQAFIYAIVAMSLDVLMGYAGLGSLGHAAFFAIGAYTTAILITRQDFGFAGALISSIGMAVVISAIVGILALRAAGIYFLMITLVTAMSVWGLLYRWVSLTGGDSGIAGILRPELGLPWSMANNVYFYYMVLVFFLVCVAFFLLFVRSPFGRTLVGIRDSESRMKVLGYNVWLHKYIAFIIAGAFAGLAGNLYAYYNGFVAPSLSDLSACMLFVLMVIMGGRATIIGPIIGAVVVTFLEYGVSMYTDRWVMVFSTVFILVALYAPKGILGWLRGFRERISENV